MTHEYRVEPGRLTLDIPESGFVGLAGEGLAALHELGVRLAVDDFGSGYSNLAYL